MRAKYVGSGSQSFVGEAEAKAVALTWLMAPSSVHVVGLAVSPSLGKGLSGGW